MICPIIPECLVNLKNVCTQNADPKLNFKHQNEDLKAFSMPFIIRILILTFIEKMNTSLPVSMSLMKNQIPLNYHFHIISADLFWLEQNKGFMLIDHNEGVAGYLNNFEFTCPPSVEEGLEK